METRPITPLDRAMAEPPAPRTTKRLPSERGYGIPRNRRFLDIRNITIARATPTTTAELTSATMISGGEPEVPDDGR